MTNKITELINNEGRVTYSFEVTPDFKEDEFVNSKLEPLFFSITWHAQTHECRDMDIAPLKLAKRLRSNGKHVLLHISCTNMKKDYLDNLLVMLQDKGICNLFIILGDNYNSLCSDFKCSQDMILHIRQRTGNYFCIGVAGFPGRLESILRLKEKVNCGVDFILTQAFFEPSEFGQFITNCKEAGITVPIIPGIFPFEKENELKCFANMCKVHVKEDLLQKLSKQTGIEIVSKLTKDLIQDLKINHLHFFTLNKIQRTTNLIRELRI